MEICKHKFDFFSFKKLHFRVTLLYLEHLEEAKTDNSTEEMEGFSSQNEAKAVAQGIDAPIV